MRWLSSLMTAALLLAACQNGSTTAASITLYTSVTQQTVDEVVAGFVASTSAEVEVFRAPTGELTARIAAELAGGDLTADILWLTDPLSMYAYRDQGLLAAWTPAGIDAIPAAYREDVFFGTRVLHMIVVAAPGITITEWQDLTSPGLRVALPDPGFAGSAFATLGYFALEPGFGLEFYEQLRANGAVQLASPGDVLNGVAEGNFDAGITLDFLARNAIDNGSPITRIWPEPGAIALYSPIAVVKTTQEQSVAQEFVEYVLSEEGQQLIAATGWTPARAGVAGPKAPDSSSVDAPDWSAAATQRQQLLEQYRAVFEG